MRAFSTSFKEKISKVYAFFPELQHESIVCGIIRKFGVIQGTATGWTVPPVFRLRPNASYYTIAHELTHLVQGRKNGVPHGEAACDIWTVDRMPLGFLDQKPYYLLNRIRVDWNAKNKLAVKKLCRLAIELRATVRTYISWLRNQIKEL